MAEGTCSIDGCDTKARARGWCAAHWRRWRLYGDPLGSAPSTSMRACAVEGCDRAHVARGLCGLHYSRWQKHGDPLYTPPPRLVLTCSVEGCDERAASRVWCSEHYGRWRRHGDPTVKRYGVGVEPCIMAGCDRPGTGPMGQGWCPTHYRRIQRHGSPYVTSRIVGDDVARFETYIRQGEPPDHAPKLGPCWLWVGSLTSDGYAVMAVRDLPTASAHRWSYRHHVGPLPEDLELDHLCVVTNCVNPWHLEPVPHEENVRRVNARKTHCPRGHPYDEKNTRWQRNGTGRVCKTCQRESDARRRAA